MPNINIKNKIFWILSAVLLYIVIPCSVWAAFGEDQEKVAPEFTREGDKIVAKYIPRAKNTSVLVDFEALNGKLIDVKGMDFALAKRPEVDVKDFKSALFTIEVGNIKPGAEAKVSLVSDFFSKSTEFWIFNEKSETPWSNSKAENLEVKGLTRMMVITVKDGGAFDSDGEVNGKIFLVGGPKDSFWGYALGTLFIRFFGIFLVLSILMLGMMLSGKFFEYLEKEEKRPETKIEPASKAKKEAVTETPDKSEEVSPEVAAAIAATLHIHFSGLRHSVTLDLSAPQPTTTWTQHGREQMMEDRLSIFKR